MKGARERGTGRESDQGAHCCVDNRQQAKRITVCLAAAAGYERIRRVKRRTTTEATVEGVW